MRLVSKIILGAVAGFLLSAVAATTAVSQQVAQTDREVDAVEDRLRDLRQARRSSGVADFDLFDQACPVVTYGDILSNPDDIDLSLCFALQSVEQGNLSGAVTTLERLLVLEPGAQNVRLLYAIVLFRLDSVDEAEREFLAIKEQGDAPQNIIDSIDAFLADIENRRRKLRHSLVVTAGAHFDTNRNSSPRSETIQALGVINGITNDEDLQQDDIGYLASFAYDFQYDLGLSNPHEIVGGLDVFADQQVELGRLSIQAFTADLGVRLRYPQVTVTPRVFLTNLRLGGDKSFQAEGVSVRADKRFDTDGIFLANFSDIDAWWEGKIQVEGFHDTRQFRSLQVRDGRKYNQELGAGVQIAPDQYLTFIARQEIKSAASDPNSNGHSSFSYRDHSAEIQHNWLFGDGHFLLSRGSLGVRVYRNPDVLVTGNSVGGSRRENPMRAGVTYGMPLEDVVGFVSDTPDAFIPELIGGSTVLLSSEYLKQQSNITNFEYENIRFQALVTKRFEF